MTQYSVEHLVSWLNIMIADGHTVVVHTVHCLGDYMLSLRLDEVVVIAHRISLQDISSVSKDDVCRAIGLAEFVNSLLYASQSIKRTMYIGCVKPGKQYWLTASG